MEQLKDILKAANITQLDIANELGIRSLTTIYQKINNKSDFTVNEAVKLKNLINSKLNKKYTIEELFDDYEKEKVNKK